MAIEDRFEIGRAIHVGQVATAYEAVQKNLDRPVLLKVIHPQWAKDPELLERFSREGKAVALVSHHNVVRVFESGWEDGLPYLALEWVEGGTLADRVQGGPLAQDEVRRIAGEILKGLEAVHRAGLLHRDIKPDNIMIDPEGTARLTDFSLAGFGRISSLTGHDGIVGSPAYMAPELLGAPPDARSDLYAVGVVLLEALTGSNPFDAGDPMATLSRIQSLTPPKLVGRPQFDPTLAKLVDSLLERDPRNRPLSAAAAFDLLQGTSSPTVNSTNGSQLTKSAHASALSWGLLGATSLAVFITIMISGEIKREPPPKFKVFKPSKTVNAESALTSIVGQSVAAIDSEQVGNVLPSVPDDTIRYFDPTPAVPSTGSLVLIVTPWGEVELDGKSLGATPLGLLSLPVGKHALMVSHPDLPSVKRRITIESATTDTLILDLKAEAAAAFVSALPWGYLWVDGDSIGLLPRDGPVWLAAGSHLLGVTHPDYGWWSDSVGFKAGERVNLRVDLPRGTLIATPYSGRLENGGETAVSPSEE